MRTKSAILLMLVVSCAFAQPAKQVEEFNGYLMQTKKGALFVFNGSSHAFSIEVISNKLKPTNDQLALLIDNIIFRPFVLPYRTVTEFDKMPDQRQKELLQNYINYEFDFFKNDQKQDISNLSYEWLTLNDKLFIYWIYDMPKSNKMVEKQMYVTTICFDNVLTLNMPLQSKSKSLEFHKGLLIDISRSYKAYNTVVDLDKMYEANK